MIYQYLLDTNIISDLAKNSSGATAKKIAAIGEEKICTSIVVQCELYFGAEKKGANRLKQRLDIVLSKIPVLPLESPIEQYYARVRTDLEKKGTPIGSNDLLIASHGLMLGLTVVTANVREFSRVSGLTIENWLISDNG